MKIKRSKTLRFYLYSCCVYQRNPTYTAFQLAPLITVFVDNFGYSVCAFWAETNAIIVKTCTLADYNRNPHLLQSTMWHEKQLDETMRRRIQGHSGKGIGEQVYSHIDFEMLKAELNKL